MAIFTKGRTGAKAPYFGLTGGWLTFWVSVACATDMTLFGYDQGVFGGVIVTPDFLDTLNLSGPEHTSLLGTVTALYDVGCFFGAVAAFSLGERLGRKKSVLLGTTVMSIGAILQISSFSVAQMIVGRIVAGLGNGLNTATAPVWQAETSKAAWRGKLVVIELILNIAGFSLSNWITYGFSYVNGPVAWRFPLAFQFIFIFILYGTVPWLPESPRWLIAHGQVEEAEHIIADLEATTVDDAYVVTESKEIQWAVQYERENGVSWWDLLRGKSGNGTSTVRRLLLGAGAQAMQQLAGINVTSYYLPTVLIQSVGLSEKLARLLAACNSVSYLAFSMIGIPNVERWGRRKMMIYASIGQALSYMLITILLRYNELPGYSGSKQVASASVAFFFTYYICFGIGFQGVPWLYPTEINSLSMRTKGAALGTASNWAFNFMVVEITPIGIQSLHWKFYIIWTVFNASFVPIVYLFYPETADRTLEDVDRLFRENQNIFVFRDPDAISTKRPLAYIEHEQAEVRRNSSVVSANPEAIRRRLEALDRANKEVDEEKGAKVLEQE
ncbi:hypothetical protein HO173_002986 [Letharia columbiana]|uniref:Major facilitator superfamily (MFS) profile domain-containing protein n=1 Tax=Letharia columbiana TaxID=112416 RepID=A0A8H6L869_9LECA|nr:uncharacterized protein HO173_002986 [Letharia columbiana]KAF6239114.1 hypothetical protein HO173_002986 [Letharia columbiana]